MKKENYNVAVVGATGAVGEQMRELLEEREFPVGELRLLASERSAGQFLSFNGKQIRVDVLTEDSFNGIDIGLFSAGGSVSAKFAPVAVNAGAVVVDNTACFRMAPDIPLVVPEVNAKEIAHYKNRGIVANPNCSTIQMVVALKPIHDAARIKRVVVSTYQSVSGAGRKAMEELSQQRRVEDDQRDAQNFRRTLAARHRDHGSCAGFLRPFGVRQHRDGEKTYRRGCQSHIARSSGRRCCG